jgi:hypothetical protein
MVAGKSSISSTPEENNLAVSINKKPSKDRNPEGYKPKPTAYEKLFDK